MSAGPRGTGAVLLANLGPGWAALASGALIAVLPQGLMAGLPAAAQGPALSAALLGGTLLSAAVMRRPPRPPGPAAPLALGAALIGLIGLGLPPARAPGPRAAAIGGLPLAAAGPLLLSAAGRSWPASVAGALLMGAGFGLALGAARAHASARALRGDARALQVFNDLPNAGSLIGFGLMLPATAIGGLPAGLLLAGALGLGAAAVALAQPAAEGPAEGPAEGSAGSSR